MPPGPPSAGNTRKGQLWKQVFLAAGHFLHLLCKENRGAGGCALWMQ